jgi:hypothetical protein
VRDQVLAALGLRHLGRAGEQFVERAEPLQKLGRRLRADPRHARHVVHRVADEGQEIDDLIRPDAPFRGQLGGPEQGVGPQVQEPDAVAEQLPGVLVGRGDRARAAARHGAAGERGEHVVGLEARDLETGDAHRLEQAAHERDLRHEVGRHLRAGGLVAGEPLVAERGARRIHRAEQIVGPLLAHDVEQVAGEAVDRRHGRAVGGGHFRQCVEELVDPRQRVDGEHGLPVEFGIGSRGSLAHASASIPPWSLWRRSRSPR